ncbi:MAG: hypothetical protein AMXMBFR33_05940 [Candidatus Xenobia bacterium]
MSLREPPLEPGTLLDAMPASAALLDSQAVIVAVNAAWRRFGAANGLRDPEHCLGQSYLEACKGSPEALEVAAGIGAILAGERSELCLRYTCHSPEEDRWYRVTVRPVGNRGALVSHLDVTEYAIAELQAERKLREQNELLSEAQRLGGLGCWEMDLQTGELRWSAETCALFGLRPGDFPGDYEAFRQMVLPDDGPCLARNLEIADATGGRIEHEYRIRRADGEVRWMLERGQVELGFDGRPWRRAGVIMDITERKVVEAQAGQLHTRAYAAFRDAAIGMNVVNLEGRFILANAAYCAMLGYSEQELLALDVASLTHPDDRVATTALIGELTEGKRSSYVTEKRYLARDGRVVWARASVSALRDARGAPLSLVGVTEDITLQKKAEEELRRSQALQRMASSMIRMGAWSVDLPQSRLTWSDEVCDIHEQPRGYAPTFEEAMSYYPPHELARLEEAFGSCIEEGRPFDLELEMVTRTGRRIFVRALGEAVRDGQGTVVQVQGAFQDITKLREAELRRLEVENRLARTLDSISDAFFALDRDWRFQYLNREAERLLLRSRQELLGRNLWDEFPEAVGSAFEQAYRKAVQQGVMVELEEFFPPLQTWFSVRAYPSEDGLAVYFSDVNEKREGHRRLEESERRFRELSEHIRDVFFVLNPEDQRFTFVSSAYERVWGRTCQSLYEDPFSFLEAVLEPDRPLAEATLTQAFQGRAFELEFRVLRPDGEVRWVLASSYPVQDTQGSIERIVGTVRDITERKTFELSLQASEERFRLLSRATNDAIYDWDLETQRLWWNEGFESLFGYRREEVEPTVESWTSRIHPEDREAVVDSIHAAMEGGESWSGEYRFRRQDGSYAYILDRGHIIRTSRGEPVRMVGGMTDLSERKETELRLREQAALIDQASDAIIVRSLDNRVLFWNRRAEEMYGWTAAEVTGRPVAELLYSDPTPLENATALLLEQGLWSGELEQRARDGSKLTVLARWTVLKSSSGEPLSILAINADITEKRRIEQQFLRAQRLESIGTLASGIAHDLNNILSPILMAIAMLKEQAQGADALALVETLHSSAQRGADLVRQIVGIARGTDGHRDLVDLRRVLEDVCHIARDAFPRNIELEHRAVSDLWPVRADATQLHQVLMNLYLNARDAMPDGGRLSATLENMELDEAFLAGHPEARPGLYVVFSLEDTGTGMAAETLEKLFEPFFTTKDLGQGTGLGLPTSLSIVKNHGGFIHVYSELGRGSCFRVYLPADTSGDELPPPGSPALLPQGTGELILLVDDEENLRRVASKALEGSGYRVLQAANGAEGLELFERHRREVALVVSDMSMPVMDGPAMIARLLAQDPDLPVIGSSGLSHNDLVVRAREAGVVHFVPKPFTIDVLLRKLREVLDGRSSGGGSRVLFVEDEVGLSRLAERILAADGHRVLVAGDGEEALRVLEQQHGNVDLIITDLRMPRMDGIALCQEVERLYPGKLFVFATGEAELPPMLAQRLGSRLSLLLKPYLPEALQVAARRALGQ